MTVHVYVLAIDDSGANGWSPDTIVTVIREAVEIRCDITEYDLKVVDVEVSTESAEEE